MEPIGSMYEGEWSCLSKMYTTTEESDFMAQFLGGLDSVPNDATRNFVDKSSFVTDSIVPDESSSSFLTHETGIFCYDQTLRTSLSLSVASSDHCMPDIKTPGKSLKNKYVAPIKNPGKKMRNSENMKNKRNVKQRKIQKVESTSEIDEDAIWGPKNSESSSITCSENEISGSQVGEGSSSQKVKPALNLNGKTRANRGSATDPQSLYARKRRERINERLKTLQGLVPNGTKVDISTMLEEAAQYVKFLQLQIKLLSSDDLWMYAPLAYNGMNIELLGMTDRTAESM